MYDDVTLSEQLSGVPCRRAR